MNTQNNIVHASGDQIRNLRELDHDPYHSHKKLEEPAGCPECNAVYHQGRWQWMVAPLHAHQALCPACQRIKDQCPAGFLKISGDFLSHHADEISQLIHHTEDREKREHALKRIMDIHEETDGSLNITFTDPHLARNVGEALHSAYKGDLDYHYHKGEYFRRVRWCR